VKCVRQFVLRSKGVGRAGEETTKKPLQGTTAKRRGEGVTAESQLVWKVPEKWESTDSSLYSASRLPRGGGEREFRRKTRPIGK